MINIGLIINYLLPNALFYGVQWGNENDYNNIKWYDLRKKPTWEEIINNIDNANCEDIRKKIINEIDSYTKKLIENGFQFDGRNFSLSQNAQINWIALNANYLRTKIDKDKSGILWPDTGFPIPTSDDGVYYLLLSKADDFFNICFPLMVGIIKSGSDEKDRVLKMNYNDLKLWKDARKV